MGPGKEYQARFPVLLPASNDPDKRVEILRKRALNAPVKVVYTTDGSGSNSVMAKEELATLRISEALAACDLLHVSHSDVTFLGFEDGKLNTWMPLSKK